jgi:hypothetical protein
VVQLNVITSTKHELYFVNPEEGSSKFLRKFDVNLYCYTVSKSKLTALGILRWHSVVYLRYKILNTLYKVDKK